MTSRQQTAAKNREKHVNEAKEIICEKGLTNTSIDEITERCGVAKGTFYTYFKRKEDIVFELSRGMFDEILDNAKKYEGTFLDKLENYMVNFSGYIEKSSPKLCQEWIKNVVVPEWIGSEADKGKLQKDIAAVHDLLQFGVDSGALRSDTPAEQLALVITDLLYGQMLCWCMSNGAYSFEQRTQMFCRSYLFVWIKNYLI